MCLRYLFVDMNSYFASVEQQDRPWLRDRPVGVIPMKADTTCCIAASYEAKHFGVKTGTGVREAKQLCPQVRLVIARPKRYVQVHHQIIDAVESCLHVDQVCSIDEMYGRLMGQERQPPRAVELAQGVKAAIRAQIGEYVRCSIGLAPNVWLAKVGTDLQKPDGLTVILKQDLPKVLYDFQLTDLPGIAKGMQRRLYRHGVKTVEQLCGLTEARLAQVWDSKVLGTIWWHHLHGLPLPYKPTRRRTVGHSHVLPPWQRTDEGARAVLAHLIHRAAARMRRYGHRAGCMTVSIRFMDKTRWKRTAPLGLCSDTMTMLQALADLWRGKLTTKPLKVSVVLTHLVANDYAQTLPFGEPQRRDRLARTMDKINDRYGQQAAYFACMYNARQDAPTRISFTQIPGMDEF